MEPIRDIRGISVSQPFASLLATGAKEFETRTWSSGYRGWVAIHATSRHKNNIEACRLVLEDPIIASFLGYPKAENLPYGAVIAVARMVDCYATGSPKGPVSETEKALGNWARNRFGFRLQGPILLPEPIRCNGALGLWQVAPFVLEKINTALAAHR